MERSFDPLKNGLAGDRISIVEPMESRSARDEAGRFQGPTWSAYDLVIAVRGIALRRDPLNPTELTQAQFNRLRAHYAPAGTPTAEAIQKRLDRPWREIVRFATQSKPSRRDLARLLGEIPDRSDLTEEDVKRALVAAALHCQQPTLRRIEYEQAVAELEAAQSRRWGSVATIEYPTLGQLDYFIGRWQRRDAALSDWGNLLALAGLAPPAPAAPPRAPKTRAELLRRCLDEYGVMPSERELFVYANSRGLPVPGLGGESWADIQAEVLTEWRGAGKEEPRLLGNQHNRPGFAALEEPQTDLTRRRWTEEDVIAGMVEFLDATSGKTNQRAYRVYALGRRDVCPPSNLHRYGGFGRIRDLAEERRRRR